MYAKIFSQIFDSSIADDYKLRHFFMDLLVLADPNGVVDMTASAISSRTRIPLPEVTDFLIALEKPDPESRTPDADGRRIAKLDDHRTWGWCILNYDRFRAIASEEQRRQKTLERVRKHRGKAENQPCNAPVTLGNACNAMQKQKQKQKNKHKEPDFIEKEDGRGVTQSDGVAQKLMLALGTHFNRNPMDRWGYDEEFEACQIAKRVRALQECSDILAFYADAKGEVHLRASILSVLKNWTVELDKARNHKLASKPDSDSEIGWEQQPGESYESWSLRMKKMSL